MQSARATKTHVLQALTGKEMSFKELFKLMKNIRSQKDLSRSSKFNNISINININNEATSPGEESPRFKVNATHSILTANNSGIYSHLDYSSRKESLATSRSSGSTEGSMQIKRIMRNLKDKLARDGLQILAETVREVQRNLKFSAFWKVHQLVNFKNAVHVRIRDHISKKSYIPRFLKLVYQWV